MSRAVLTIAQGKKIYVDMACNLAMSFLLWNDTKKIHFNLVTDLPHYIPSYLQDKITITYKISTELGSGFLSKLQISDLVQHQQTLFIDSDCLVYGDLSSVFEKFKSQDVSVIGYNKTEGYNIGFCKEIRSLIATMDIPYFPLMCGSVYFVRNNKNSKRIFDYAKGMIKDYDKIGLLRLRGQENEEPLMAIAMAKFNQMPVEDSGKIKADRMFYQFLKSNVLRGKAILWNEIQPTSEYSKLMNSEPLIIHYAGSNVDGFEYRSEALRLRKVYEHRWNHRLTNCYVYFVTSLPGYLKITFKNIFRPLYRFLFGVRNIELSNRMK